MKVTDEFIRRVAVHWGGADARVVDTAYGVDFVSVHGERYRVYRPGKRFPCFEDSGRPCGTIRVPAGRVYVRPVDDAPDGWFEVTVDDPRLAALSSSEQEAWEREMAEAEAAHEGEGCW